MNTHKLTVELDDDLFTRFEAVRAAMSLSRNNLLKQMIGFYMPQLERDYLAMAVPMGEKSPRRPTVEGDGY